MGIMIFLKIIIISKDPFMCHNFAAFDIKWQLLVIDVAKIPRKSVVMFANY